MNYFIMQGQIFTIFLSLAHLTSINFPDKVVDYVGGHQGDFKIYELNHRRSLVYEVKRKDIAGNFITFLKDKKFYFNLSYNEQLANKDITLKAAKKCSYFTLLKESKEYQLFECPRSLFFVNKTKRSVKINELFIKDSIYLSKGPPIYLNGKMIYYQGRVL